MKPSLLILAAGMGSRYGGLKQVDPVGPSGETIIDYSVYDALRAGFGKLVFVIRRDIEAAFREHIGSQFEKRLPVEYVFQELDKLPSGFHVPQDRTKPWGTAHAILASKDIVGEPFAAINADDFYGQHSFQVLADHLRSDPKEYAMVGFKLQNTLSEHGTVSRGVCACDEDGYLREIHELTEIKKTSAGALAGKRKLSGNEVVSMNFWGFTPALFPQLEETFADFLRQHGGDPTREWFIPTVVNELIAARRVRVKVLTSADTWFGVTYKDDRPKVADGIRRLIEGGRYPPRLWD